MATDPVVEYWAEMMKRMPISPEVMVQWKRVMDHSLEAWSRALSEVMATEDFARLLGTSIEQWLATQAPPITANGGELTALATQVGRLEERLRQLEERIDGIVAHSSPSPDSASDSDSARTPRRGRRRRAA
jgi:hypothetical protein